MRGEGHGLVSSPRSAHGKEGTGVGSRLSWEGQPAPGGQTAHASELSGLRPLQQNSKDREGEVRAQGRAPRPPRGPVSGWHLWGRGADWQEPWVLVPILPLICCVTLGNPPPLSDSQSVQGED